MKASVAAMLGLALVLATCQTQSRAGTPAQASPAAQAQAAQWVPVDMSGSGSGGRAAAYDATRNCLWIVTRAFPGTANDTEHATLTRVNLADRTVADTGLHLDDTGWVGAWVFVDGQGIVWMAWGRVVYGYEPDTNSLTTHVMPVFEHFGIHPSLYSTDGWMTSAGRDASGEIWTAFLHVGAIFGFNPAVGTWDRVAKLPWFPYFFTTIASPRPGLLTINGYRTPDDKAVFHKFAEVDTTTGAVRDYSVDVRGYTLVDPQTVLFTDWSDNFARLDLDTGDVTVLDGEAPSNANGAPFLVADGNHVWYAMGIGVGNIDVRSGAMKRYEFPPLVFTTPVPNVCDRGPHGFAPTCSYPCPTGVTECIPKPVTPAAEIYALEFDRKGNVWAVTDRSNVNPGPLGAVMELRMIAA